MSANMWLVLGRLSRQLVSVVVHACGLVVFDVSHAIVYSLHPQTIHSYFVA